MKLSQMRRHRKRPSLLPAMVADNPLLILGLDLPFIVIAAISLKNAVAFSIEMLFIHLVTMVIACYVAPKLQVWQRIFVTATVSTLMMLLSRELVILLIPDIENYAGMYLYLMAVNGVTLFQSTFLSRKATMPRVVKTAFLNVGAFSITMIGVSAVREYFGGNTLWGIQMPAFVKLEGMRAPFFGFIFLGFLLALGHFINRKMAGFYILENVRRENLAQGSVPTEVSTNE